MRLDECRHNEKVGGNDREQRLCDETHVNNNHWRSSNDDSRIDGQKWFRAKKRLTSDLHEQHEACYMSYVRCELCESGQRNGSSLYHHSDDNDGNYCDIRDRNRQHGP